MKSYKSVDAYIQAQPVEFRSILEKLRAQIKKAAPKAVERISYGMPTYTYKGALVYFGAFKNHCSFFPGNSTLLAHTEGLEGYKLSKGTIQFTLKNPLPAALVKSMVKERVLENETREALKESLKAVKKTSFKILKKKAT